MPLSITEKLSAPAGIGGLVQGNFGNYFVGTDGTITVDSRDVSALLSRGFQFVTSPIRSFNSYPRSPAAASATAFIASTTVTNGAVAITQTQPDVPRQGQLVLTALASPGPSAGTVSIAYTANDGVLTTDVFSAVTVGTTPKTSVTSKGVVHIASTAVTGAGITGGTVAMTLGSTAVLSVPVDPGAQDFAVIKETIDTGDEAVGTVSTVTLGSIAPTTAPNGTHTYSFLYSSISPNQ